mmetsp:Transcript_109305/g.308444  ORF Transcript_109305/g.308444 Transcript_109305/m.308444 type:complete len:319 (-) Transcript_109305:993-1949(-)
MSCLASSDSTAYSSRSMKIGAWAPSSVAMPKFMTMRRARPVACRRSDVQPAVTFRGPKISSSAALPPINTSRRAWSSKSRSEYFSRSGMLHVMPSALPRGMIVALCTGSAPMLPMETSVWPPSWYAVRRFSWSLIGFARSKPTTTRSKASSKYLMGTPERFSAEERTAAMLRMLKRSAPVMPAVRRASVSSSTFLSSTNLDAYICKISVRPFKSGIGTTTCLSRRPGRVSALSKDSGKFVAQMTTTPLFWSKPSNSTKSWFRVILTAVLSRLERLDPTASISSMKTMQGACLRASWKRSRMRRAPTPTNISSNSDPEA